jgi:hypothetical protein
MAFGLIFNRAVKQALKLLTAYAGNDLKVDLFTNAHDPARADTLSDYTLASYPGYSQFDWETEPITVDGSNRGVTVPALATFSAPTSGSPVDVYGWIVQYWDGFDGAYSPLGADTFSGGPVTLTVGDPNLVFGLVTRDFDAH